MKPAGNPWMKFYPADWRSDPMLRLCCLAARGLWVEMLCIMHEAIPYGSLLVNGRRLDKRQMASLVGVSEKECTTLLMQLEAGGVFSRDADGIIYSRRMRRDAEKAEQDKANGKKGGNPKVKGGVNPPDNGEVKAQKPEASSESKKDSDATASGAEAPDPRTRLFNEGLKTLGRLTGKGPDACRSFVGKCLKASSDDAIIVLGLIEDAERNQVVDPSAWISSRLKGPQNGPSGSKIIQAADDLRRKIASFDGPAGGDRQLRGGEGAALVRLLPNG